jgi:hypothetical protein
VITRRTFIAGSTFGFVAAPGAGVLIAEQALRLGYPKAGGSRSCCTPVIRGVTGIRMATMIRIGEQDRVAAVIQGGIA